MTETLPCGDPIAEILAEGYGLQPADGGFRVKTTPHGHVDIIRMIYSWRICRTPLDSPMTYDRGWCYNGTGPRAFTAAALAAKAWDGADDTGPAGWNKNLQTQEWREPER